MKTITLFFVFLSTLVSAAPPVPVENKQMLILAAEEVVNECTEFLKVSGGKVSANDRERLESCLASLRHTVETTKAGDIGAAQIKFEQAFAKYIKAIRATSGLK